MPADAEAKDWPFLRALAAQGELGRTFNRVVLEETLVQCHEALKVALELLLAR